MVVAPRDVREGSLRDHPHPAGERQGERSLDRLLIRDTDRGLERVEPPAFDGVARGFAVAAVADVARPAALASLLQRLDGLALSKLGERAAVELDEIDVVGIEAAQAPLDAGQQRRTAPVGARPAAGVPTLREEPDVLPPGTDRLADQALAVVVALRGVDHVETGVERASEQPRDRPRAYALIADLGSAESEHARHDVRPAEPALLHRFVRAPAGRRHGPRRYHSRGERGRAQDRRTRNEEDAHDEDQRSRTSGAGGSRLLSDRAGDLRPGTDAGAAHGAPRAAHAGARRALRRNRVVRPDRAHAPRAPQPTGRRAVRQRLLNGRPPRRRREGRDPEREARRPPALPTE